MSTLYKTDAAKNTILALYDQRLQRCAPDHESRYVPTSFGQTHVIICGNRQKPALVVLHGINAGAPMALECMTALFPDFCLYAIDTIGQATRSAETKLSYDDGSFGFWLDEVFEQLQLKQAHVVGISFGAFLLQKLMTHAAHRIDKAVFVVPGGLVDGAFWPSMKLLSWPLMRFMFNKTDDNLKRFLSAFYNEIDEEALLFHRTTLTGIKMDYRRPKQLQKKDVAHFNRPVYGIFADTDVFFPGQQALGRCKELFSQFKAFHLLKGCKHIPDASYYAEISQQLKKWLS